AQERGVRAATVGTPCEAVDAAARGVIASAGLGEAFIHRTGHGIGAEAHEDPYVVSGNTTPLVPGHAFSIEPGIYIPRRFGLRLGVYGTMAVFGVVAGLGDGGTGAAVRGIGAAAMALLAGAALATSIARRGAGVRGQRVRRAARARRVRAMVGRQAAHGEPAE